MIWLSLILLSFLTSILIYPYRFKEATGLKGKNLVQTYYIIAGLIISTSLIEILLKITSRPAIRSSFEINAIFGLILFSIFLTTGSNMIHSISILLQSKRFASAISLRVAYYLEIIHGPVSHYGAYIGGIIATLLVGILELMYGNPDTVVHTKLIIFLGTVIGICVALSIIWSGYIFATHIVALTAFSLLARAVHSYSAFYEYPYAATSLTILFVIVVLLSVFVIANSSTNKVKRGRRFILHIYPPGHPRKTLLFEV